jgi:hypothetical protein
MKLYYQGLVHTCANGIGNTRLSIKEGSMFILLHFVCHIEISQTMVLPRALGIIGKPSMSRARAPLESPWRVGQEHHWKALDE